MSATGDDDIDTPVEVTNKDDAVLEMEVLIWEAEKYFNDSDDDEDSEEQAEQAADSEEDYPPQWFMQCCVADHVEEFKKRDLIKEKYRGDASVIADPVFLWDAGEEITYTFLPGPFSGTPNQREVVIDAMREWMCYANVKFRQIYNVQDSMIRITFDRKDGNWSRLGTSVRRVKKTVRTANFCDLGATTAPSASQKAVVLHEIGHMLGLMHEHQSPSVRGILMWIEDEVKSHFRNQYKWSDATTTVQVINTEDEAEVLNYTHLDLKSIMVYPIPSSTNIGPTGKGITIPANEKLSVYDKAFIAIHYPYLGPNPHAPQWDFNRALREIKLGDEINNMAIQKFKQGDWQGIREELPRWYFHERARMNLLFKQSLH